MKTKYIAIAVLALTTLVSCNRDEDNLFEKSAAQRAQEAITNAQTILPAPENGWEMVYFPNKEDMSSSRGYILIVKFSSDGSVSVTAKNSLTTNKEIVTDAGSTWKLISDYGPLLSFDTYNKVLHAWSDPQSDGDGYLGDYEFLILKATPEIVVLKGKKHSAYSVLRPMKTADIAAHYAACEKMQSDLFGNGNIVTLQQGNKTYTLYNGASGIFRMENFGEALDLETAEHFPMCATADGIVVSYGFGDNANERVYMFTNNQLVGECGSVIGAGNMNQSFTAYISDSKGWSADMSLTTGEIESKVSAFVADLQTLSKDKTKAAVSSLMIGYSSSANMYQGAYYVRVRFQYKDGSKTKTENADFEVTLVTSDSNVEITYIKPMTDNAMAWANATPSIEELAKMLCGTFTATPAAGHEFNAATGLNLNGNNSQFYLKSATIR